MPPSGALRPLLPSSRRLLLEQVPPVIPRRNLASTRSISLSRSAPRTLPICLACSLQPGRRLYSTETRPPSPDKANPTTPKSTTTTSATDTSHPTPELPSTTESRRSPLLRRLSTSMDALQQRALTASQRLNDLTGYTAIDAIKQRNTHLEAALRAAQTALAAARLTYRDVHARRAATQREVTALLTRKDTWTPADVERFTALYREDHSVESAVTAAAAALADAEAADARLGAQLNAGMLARYHEEQVWSDRIRRASTWGTWGLMGVNVVLFLALQFVAEPWRRGRLVRAVAEAEQGLVDEVRREVAALRGVVEGLAGGEAAEEAPAAVGSGGGGARLDGPVVATSPVKGEESGVSWKEVYLDPHRWGNTVAGLYSERRIELRMRDASLLALEGAVAGAAVAVGATFLLLRTA